MNGTDLKTPVLATEKKDVKQSHLTGCSKPVKLIAIFFLFREDKGKILAET